MGANAAHTGELTKTVMSQRKTNKGEGGKKLMGDIDALDQKYNEKHADIGYSSTSVSENSKKRANKHYEKQAATTAEDRKSVV